MEENQPIRVPGFVQDIVMEVYGKYGSPLHVGLVTTNPETQKTVKITDGRFWGEHGLSNFWYWKEVFPNGELSETEERGYGWFVKDDK
jgi:hypothetical protein